MDYHLRSVDQVRENLIQMTKIALAPWVMKQKRSFTVGDIYKDPSINSDLYANPETINAIRQALLRLNCQPVQSNELDLRFMPPIHAVEELLVS